MGASIQISRTLPLLFCLFSATGANEKCSHLTDVEKKWIPQFEKFHEGLNLTFDCEAMKKADDSAIYLKAGVREYGVSNEWCQYSRMVWDPLYINFLYSKSPPLEKMPFDKINKTAQLHPNTKYGCSARMRITRFSIWFTIVCIYKRIADETRCFCN
ncbi:hypothetical protein Q1695_015931 [Nippostrongylus brasiliensis]|nr:hypothetical protein Q1695_015931 [Nippostrongylus brasiliensis]